MNIQEGNYYIARNGELVGPVVKTYRDLFYFSHQGIYDRSGRSAFWCMEITDTVDHAAMKAVEGNA